METSLEEFNSKFEMAEEIISKVESRSIKKKRNKRKQINRNYSILKAEQKEWRKTEPQRSVGYY